MVCICMYKRFQVCILSRLYIYECDSKRYSVSLIRIGFDMASLQDVLAHESCVGIIYVLEGEALHIIPFEIVFTISRPYLSGNKRFQTVNTNVEMRKDVEVFSKMY
jgi:hypothetical protein